MHLPSIDDERTTLSNFLDDQLAAIRASAHGLTDEQSRLQPLRSALSISGIIKHISFCMRQSLSNASVPGYEGGAGDFFASFAPAEDETLDGLLAEFDGVRRDYMSMCHGGDLDAVLPVGPLPWFGMDEARPATLRYLYADYLQEFARHAGHADIIREELDGAQAASLLAAVEARPANEWVTPWGQ